jgi:hypothetical protein
VNQKISRWIKAICMAITLFLSFSTPALAQWGSAHFVDNHPEDIYLLPGEQIVDEQYLSSNSWNDRIVTFELYVSQGNMSSNQNFSFTGCEEWLEDIGSVIDSTDLYDYRANWIADDEGATWFRVFMIQFTNNLPIGQATYYMSSIGGHVRTSQGGFESFSDYHPRTIHSIDGIRGDVNGDGAVSQADVELLQEYCFSPQSHEDWRYSADGINVGRGMIMFGWPTLVDAYRINLFLADPNDPLAAGLGLGELISSTTYGYGGNSVVEPVPYELSQNGNTLMVNTDGQYVAIFCDMPNNSSWQTELPTINGTATFQLPEGAENIRVAAVTQETSTSINTPVEQPTTFSLKQNYPNPFNPTTTIDFDLANQAQVKLTVYNMAGQKVATLADGIMPAGSNSVNFDASNLTSGVYFYTLIADGQTQSHKMTLMK